MGVERRGASLAYHPEAWRSRTDLAGRIVSGEEAAKLVDEGAQA
jgi:hypothetical protein